MECADRPGIGERIRSIAEALAPHARSAARCGHACASSLAGAQQLRLPTSVLSRIGYRDTAFDVLLAASLACEGANGCERTPHRQLEQEWMLRVWCPSGAPAPEARGLTGRTALALPADLLTMRKDALYALTHTAVTDPSRPEAHPVAARPRAHRRASGSGSGGLPRRTRRRPRRRVAADDPGLRLPWSASTRLAFSVLARVEDDFGFLPSPGITRERLKRAQRRRARTLHRHAVISHRFRDGPALRRHAAAGAQTSQIAASHRRQRGRDPGADRSARTTARLAGARARSGCSRA